MSLYVQLSKIFQCLINHPVCKKKNAMIFTDSFLVMTDTVLWKFKNVYECSFIYLRFPLHEIIKFSLLLMFTSFQFHEMEGYNYKLFT